MSTLIQNINSDWKKNSIGYSALAIILSTCLGSLAVMSILVHGVGTLQLFQLFLIVAACNAYNASVLTVQKPSVILKFLIVSLVLSSLLGVLNLL